MPFYDERRHMKQRFVLILTMAILATPLAAQDVGSQISEQLRAQGYDAVVVTKTWLGRLRIEARSDGQTREIIVNPRTGEILRDFLSNPSGDRSLNIQILDRPASGNEPESRPPSKDDAGRPERGGDRGSNGVGPEGPGPGTDPTGSRGPSR